MLPDRSRKGKHSPPSQPHLISKSRWEIAAIEVRIDDLKRNLSNADSKRKIDGLEIERERLKNALEKMLKGEHSQD